MSQSVASAIPAVAPAFGAPTFTKHAADGSVLPADASAFAFVRVSLGDHAFDVLPDDVGDDELTFANAQRACAELDALGSKDWRLPTRRELLALVDDTRRSPAVDQQFFPTLQSEWYWTGTPYAASPADYAWCVHFGYGDSFYLGQDGTAFVRAVRSVVPAGQ